MGSAIAGVVLDRDGVILRQLDCEGVRRSARCPEECEFFEDVRPACDRLRAAGLQVAVATNQPDVARGLLRLRDLEAMHNLVRETLGIDDVVCCPHDDGQCQCRKPLPGLLLTVADRWKIDPSRLVIIGDTWRDIESGLAAGCRTIWLDRGEGERPDRAEVRVCSLGEAVDAVIKEARSVYDGT